MLDILVCFQRWHLCGRVLALITRISNVFMFACFMILQITNSSGRIFAEIAGVPNTVIPSPTIKNFNSTFCSLQGVEFVYIFGVRYFNKSITKLTTQVATFINVQFPNFPKVRLGDLRRHRLQWGTSAAARTDMDSFRLGNCTFWMFFSLCYPRDTQGFPQKMSIHSVQPFGQL